MHNYVTDTGLRLSLGTTAITWCPRKMQNFMLSSGHDKTDSFYGTVPTASAHSVNTSASGLYLTGDWFESLRSMHILTENTIVFAQFL